jgi:aminoglycoside phosphotransferase (APT) family kinase protein
VEEDWERPARVQLEPDVLQHLLEPAFPGGTLAECSVLTAGLANTNMRFRMEGAEATYVLRLHTRARESARRERDLMALFARQPRASVPVPPLLYVDPVPERGSHPYSIWGFVEGTLLEQLFRTLPPSELVAIAGVCGGVLASLAQHRFSKCGELGPELSVVREYGPASRFVPEAVHRALFEGRAGARLGATLRDELWRVVERTSPRLEVIDHRHLLVHGDYKRSNLLLRRGAATWQVAAVLDWEFAFAGPALVDVGIFLRAGSALPDGFCDAFAAAYRGAGGELPLDWLALSRLIDVVSMLTFLEDSRERPRVFAECVEVLKETLRMLA